jgi:hypothetical protein
MISSRVKLVAGHATLSPMWKTLQEPPINQPNQGKQHQLEENPLTVLIDEVISELDQIGAAWPGAVVT